MIGEERLLVLRQRVCALQSLLNNARPGYEDWQLMLDMALREVAAFAPQPAARSAVRQWLEQRAEEIGRDE